MTTKKLTAKQAEKALDARITKAYGQACRGVQIPIMEIPRIFKHAKEADARGEDLVEAIRAFVRTIVGAVEGGEALGEPRGIDYSVDGTPEGMLCGLDYDVTGG